MWGWGWGWGSGWGWGWGWCVRVKMLGYGATCLLQLRFVRSSRVMRKASLASSEGKPHDMPPMALAAYLASAEHCCVCRKRSEPTQLSIMETKTACTLCTRVYAVRPGDT